MLGLYLGFFTATECAAVGVVLVLALIVVRGQFSWAMLKRVLWATAKTVGSLYLIVIGASVFNFLITFQIPAQIPPIHITRAKRNPAITQQNLGMQKSWLVLKNTYPST